MEVSCFILVLIFEVQCSCPCRETGQISEVVMPMIWFEEVSCSSPLLNYSAAIEECLKCINRENYYLTHVPGSRSLGAVDSGKDSCIFNPSETSPSALFSLLCLIIVWIKLHLFHNKGGSVMQRLHCSLLTRTFWVM